ncbi:MAG: terminase small subunit [Oscillospiraceae bacterium]
MAGKLNERQKRFADEYLIDLNATQAAIRAGYSPKTAYSMGQRLLKNVEVQEHLQMRQKKRETRTEITQDRVLRELANIAFANGTDFAKVKNIGGAAAVLLTATAELSEEKKAAIACIKETQCGIEVKTYDKLKALELLGKHLGIFDNGAAKTVPDNNLFEAIRDCAKGDYDGISELQQETEADNDLVD